jgi:hypothetical protein
VTYILLHLNSFSFIETRLQTKVQKQQQQVLMKLIASLAPARVNVEAGVVAKADQ